MTLAMENLLRSIWECELIRSAGYASTDVGTIGWQCLHCETDEHFAFDDVVVEIIDEEIVVTSLSRHAMPIIRYRTGDRGVWTESTCDCGNGAPKFRLRGRLDSNVICWGCWISFDDIAAAFAEMGIECTALQLETRAGGDQKSLVVRFESAERMDPTRYSQLRDRIYRRCGDLHDTVAQDFFEAHLSLEAVAASTLQRNPRTGKVIPIIVSGS